MTWKKGESGNPKGRPKGSRDTLTESVYKEMLQDWSVHGLSVIQTVREKKPELYLQAIIRLIPTSHEIQLDDSRRSIEDYSPEELAEIVGATTGDFATKFATNGH